MKMSLRKVLSFVLAMVMVIGMLPATVFAAETQQTNVAAQTSLMDGLSIAYPYNTETVQRTGTPVSRFQALTFESARNEVESAQMILTPSFDVSSFELTMHSLQNEKGNIIPAWAFEVYTQHYVTVSGSGNAPYWSDTFQMYNPTYSKTGVDGTFPDALLPQDVAMEAGENIISAGKNQGIWVNLNVQGAAPGNYTGTATLTVNGTDMEIPVSVHVYDVSLPEQVHAQSAVGIWWDMVEKGEGYIDRKLADTYFDYLVSKRIMPIDAWSLTRWDEAFADYAATYLAVSPEISSYSLFYTKNEQGSLNVDGLRTTLTTLINKNISLAQSGSDVDLFKKAYLYFGTICDEPRSNADYAEVNTITAQLDALKAELAPMLDAYPAIRASFMNLRHLVTGPNPTDKTYADKTTGSFFNKETFIDDDYGSTVLTGDSYVYAPQYQWLNTADQRALYSSEEELWWYGCCHPISPYPTYHINMPLVSARLEGWMRYAYGIDGFVYSSVNIWGDYTDNGIALYDYWNGYKNNGTPGDQILVLPGSDYGVYGPIGTIRIENIREANEDYEYLWMLENQFGGNISAYTAGLYNGTIPTDDASAYYAKRIALLEALEELSIAQNGATQIAPGNEGFVRGQEIKPSTSLTIELGNTEELATLSFDYKVTSGTFNISLNPDWDNAFGYFAFNANGNVDAYDGVSVKKLDDGYYRVTFNLSKLTKYSGNPSKALSFLYIRGAWTDATGYIDNVSFTLPGENEAGYGRVLIAADVHVSAEDANTQEHLKKTLTYAKNNNVDLLIFNGDTVNVGDEADYAALDSVFTDVFGSPEQANVKFIFNMGNHEFYPTSACAHEETDYAVQFARFAEFASKWSDFTAEQGSIYLTQANGISYIVAAPSDKWTYMDSGKLVYCAALGGYHDEDIALIDSLIAQATEANPGEPVFLLSHHPWGETYGGDSYGMPESKVVTAMRAVMEKYPHLVNVTSHTHFSSIHERSFAQDKWTTINTGMHTYGKYVDIETDVNGTALNYVNIDGRRYTSTDAEGKALHGTTHFVWDVNYGENGFTANVFNMATQTPYSHFSYTVPYGITAANKSEKFAYELADRTAPVLTWSAADALSVELVKNGSTNSLQLAFNDTDQFYATEGYRINVVNAATGETLKSVLWASRYWAAQEKKDSYEITVDGLAVCSEYKVTVEAIDFYGNYSAAKLEATVQSSGTVETETGLLLQKCNGTNADCSARDYSRIYFGTTPFTSSSDTLTLVVKTDCTSIKLRAVSNVSDDWEGSAVSKDLEDLGDGWKTATWTLSELIGSNDITTMNGFRIDSLVDGMDILMKDILINNQTDWVGEFQSNYHGVVTQQQIEVKTEEEVFRGQQIVSRTDLTIELGNTEELTSLSFDYKVTSGTFNISLNPDWDNSFGYFAFDANGNVDPYDGVTVEDLEDGYKRVTFDLSKLTKYSGNPSKVLSFLYIRGAWTDATGYIDNVQCGTYEEPAGRGQPIAPSTSLTIELGNTEQLATLSFDYKVTSGTFNISLNPDWDNAFGYFAFDANGNVDPYEGVTIVDLEDGYKRVTFDLNKLTKYNGNPSKALSFLYIRGAWTDATGYIDNVQYTVYEEPADRGQPIAPSTSLTIELGNTEQLATLSFDYKVTSGTFNISLNPDWDNAFGYFAFDANGNVDPYEGVTIVDLEDGYKRVTFDLNKLTKYSGNPGKALSFLYIRGAWTDATGFIDNVQFTAHTHRYESVVTAPTPSTQGYTTHTCSCGDSYVDSYTDYEVEGYLSLTEDMNVNLSLTEDFYVNLNGHNMTGTINTNGFKVYGIDATTDSYTCENIGYFNCVDAQGNAIVPESNHKSKQTGAIKRYLTIKTEEGYSFHRIYVGITHVSLAPSVTGFGYKAIFGGDEMVKAQLAESDAFGYNLWLAGNAPVTKSIAREKFVTGENGTPLTLRLKNFDAENYGEADVYATVFIKLADDTTIVSDEYTYDLRQMVEMVNDTYTAYNETQLDAVREMIDRNPIMQTWRIENLYYVVKPITLEYSFSGNEADRAGYAEGVVTLTDATAKESYSLYWADANGKLSGYKALGVVTVAEGQSSATFHVAENTAIPAQADRLVAVLDNTGDVVGSCLLGDKANNAQPVKKFAVISDVHTNYNQGQQYLLDALKQFQAEDMAYIIVTGDIGESDTDYAKYVSAVEESGFTGLIFASIGNHDQTDTGRKNFKTYAIYDGATKTWVGIDNAPAYFANTYAGELNVAVTLAGENLAYYLVTIDENAFIFMDQELTSTGNTPSQDNFSEAQLNFVEKNLYTYSKTHNLFIVEHAPVEQLKIGDKFDPGYGGAIQMSVRYTNNQRFVDLLQEYTEAIWLSGHTHVQYDTGIMYVDKYYDEKENLTDTPIAHAVHVSSLAQPRWYEGNSMKMPNDFSAASQGYVCYQYENGIVFEARSFKDYSPNSTAYDASLFVNQVEPAYSWIIPLETVQHELPVGLIDLAVAENGYVRKGSVSYTDTADGLQVTFAEASNRFEIKTGDQTKAVENGYYLRFQIKTDLTSLNLGGTDYAGGRKTNMVVDLSAAGDNYTLTDLGDGWILVQIPVSVLTHESILTNFAVRFYDTNAAGTFYLKEMYIAPMIEEEEGPAVDYAVAANGNVRQGSVSFTDTTDGLQVTFSETSNRFEIKTGDQSKAFAKGYDLEFKIKTDLTSFDLGGTDYAGGRKTYIPVNLSASGEGYTVTDLGNGWKHIKISMNTICHDDIVTNFAIRFYNTNAAGTFYVKELFIKSEDQQVLTGSFFETGKDLTLSVGTTEHLASLSFDYIITSGNNIVLALMPNWDSYYGYYAFNANGSVDGDQGITTQLLDNGYTRVTFDMASLNKISGNPSNVLDFIYVRGAWSDAMGYIDNISYVVAEAPVIPDRGQTIAPGTDLTLELGNTAQLATLSFDYKVTSGTFNISLNPDWDNAFGYFAFNANGNVDPYDGVTIVELEDGYKRVTFNLNALTKYNGNPGKALSFLYIRGAWTDATGYIDNIQFAEGTPEVALVDYAVAENGQKRAGNPTWEDTADGLKVTFAAASDRFEIKCGNQTANAAGTLRFKIKTDLTKIDLGGCNYTGSRKTYVSMELTASGSNYTITDLGDGWLLVELPMSVIGYADINGELAIRFYNTNAAGTFYLKDMNFVA